MNPLLEGIIRSRYGKVAFSFYFWRVTIQTKPLKSNERSRKMKKMTLTTTVLLAEGELPD
jgi:hypothetical protein